MKKYIFILVFCICLFTLTSCGDATENDPAISQEVYDTVDAEQVNVADEENDVTYTNSSQEQESPEADSTKDKDSTADSEIVQTEERLYETDKNVQEGIILDATLGQAIRKELRYAWDEILTYEDLESVTYLAPWHEGITSLTGISHLKNLRELHVGSSTISDISELAELKEITNIDISCSYIREIPDFSQCELLESLYLSGNLIKDISPVALIPNLKYADFNSNLITSIEPLKNVKTIEMLCMESNCILDFASIEGCETLINAYNQGAQASYEQALQLERRVKEILSSFPETESELELEKQLYNYIRDHMYYDETLRSAASFGYQGIMEGWGVCGDYAEAFALLANHAGLETYVCSSETHAWNIIKVDGVYYHCDALWDEDVEEWSHFNKSTEYMHDLPDHSFDKERYPDCPISMDYYN